MTELWTPSDDLLTADAIAKAKIDNPFDPDDLESAGLILPDGDSDEALEAAAAVALAEMDDSEPDSADVAPTEDDDAVEDADDEPVEEQL